MKKCDYCGTLILFGGSRTGDLRFCGEDCHAAAANIAIAAKIPPDKLEAYIRKVWKAGCPRCGADKPIGVHKSHRVTSLLVVTSWSSRPQVSCRGCGVKNQLGALAWSLFAGWWGVPWGLVMTPVQIGRNVTGLVNPPDDSEPSEALRQMLKFELAERIAEKRALRG
ncbi:MAG: hypothetical protein AAF532_08675 [Planctomycetota bacterium]